jgi:hypothetical protein
LSDTLRLSIDALRKDHSIASSAIATVRRITNKRVIERMGTFKLTKAAFDSWNSGHNVCSMKLLGPYDHDGLTVPPLMAEWSKAVAYAV